MAAAGRRKKPKSGRRASAGPASQAGPSASPASAPGRPPATVEVVETAWTCWDDWTGVHDVVCPADPAQRPRMEVEAGAEVDVGAWEWALCRMESWRARGMGPPALMQATFELMQVVLLDRRAAASLHTRRLACGMAVVRAVNFVVDDLQTGAFAQSILELAGSVGLPRWVVDIRHEATHGALPSMEVLRLAVDELLAFVRGHYWRKQAGLLADAAAAEPAAREACRRALQDALPALLDDVAGNADAVDEEVDALLARVPAHLCEAALVPVLAGALAAQCADPARWERVVAGLDDGHAGLAGMLLDDMCRRVVELRQEDCLAWVQYLVSRRWHALADDSLALFTVTAAAADAADSDVAAAAKSQTQTQTQRKSKRQRKSDSRKGRIRVVNLAEVHPKRWSAEERDFMAEAAPSRLQDCPTLLKWLRLALLSPHSASQKLVAALVMAVATKAPAAALTKATTLLRVKFGNDVIRLAGRAQPSLDDVEALLVQTGLVVPGGKGAEGADAEADARAKGEGGVEEGDGDEARNSEDEARGRVEEEQARRAQEGKERQEREEEDQARLQVESISRKRLRLF